MNRFEALMLRGLARLQTAHAPPPIDQNKLLRFTIATIAALPILRRRQAPAKGG
jgi:hypothetical protein